MIVFKFVVLLLIFVSSLYIGMMISQRYTNRVKELKDMKNALNMFETKIKFTYEAVPEIFGDIGEKMKKNIGGIFSKASKKMEIFPAGEAWIQSIDETQCCMTQEDKSILKGLR